MYVDDARLNDSRYEALDELLNIIMENKDKEDEQDNEDQDKSVMESDQEEPEVPNNDYMQYSHDVDSIIQPLLTTELLKLFPSYQIASMVNHPKDLKDIISMCES